MYCIFRIWGLFPPEEIKIHPNQRENPAPKVIVDDVDIKLQNWNEHIDIKTENVSAPHTVSSRKMEDIEANGSDR